MIANKEQMKRVCGRNVRTFRLRRMLSQERLAKAAGISQQSISKIERGAHSISLQTACNLANALNIDVAQLYTININFGA